MSDRTWQGQSNLIDSGTVPKTATECMELSQSSILDPEIRLFLKGGVAQWLRLITRSIVKSPRVELAALVRLTRLFNALPGIVFSATIEPSWSMTYLSKGCFKLTGYLDKDLVGHHRSTSYHDLLHSDDLLIVWREVQWAIAHQQPYAVEYRIRTKLGEEKWLREHGYGVFNAKGQLLSLEGFIADVTDRKQTEEGLRQAEVKYRTIENITHRKQAELELHRRDALLRGVAEATNYLLTHPEFNLAIPEVLAILGQASGADRIYLYENHPHPETGEIAMSMRFEWTQESIEPTLNKPHWQNLPYRAFGMTRWYEAFLQGRSVGGVVREFPAAEREFLSRDGILAILMVPVFVDGGCWGYIGFDECTTEHHWSASEESILVAIAASIGAAIKRQRTEQQMRYHAFHDALTGLPNRSWFNQCLLQAIAYAHHTGELLAVMFLDLDRFKAINDTLGHAMGDRLLKQATARLNDCLRQEDTIARWGGDEFTLILPALRSPEDVARIAQRISNVLKPAFYLDGHELHVTSSIGIALYPYNGTDAQTLLKNADAALHCVKAQGRNNFQFYNVTINPQANELLALDNRLYEALERDEFVIHYQPQVNIITGQVTQMEALLRWQHPERGLISPNTFIPLAEENGLIVPIGDWVLRSACAQNRAWQDAGLSPIRVAVNLSARQFEQPTLVDRVAQILHETRLNPNFLELEITETAAMRNVDFTIDTLCRLRAMGIRIAIDDFGTGYSSLSYLKQFPIHMLKIDQSFIRDLAENPKNTAIITAIIALAQGLELDVVAEGVETSEQVEKLRSLNCLEIQGHWFSRAIKAQAIAKVLRQA
ncbi:MAG: EAL domain-containing protein [Cyanobacteria bacterium RU_5_0]|nr:EAL domain-containing protein [Cyanobacteria bacterium RU_5_0]